MSNDDRLEAKDQFHFHSGLQYHLSGVSANRGDMPTIHSTDVHKKWRYACPTPDEHHNWRVVDGYFECRQCNELFRCLRDKKTGEKIPREEFDFVGADADSKGQFGRPTISGGRS